MVSISYIIISLQTFSAVYLQNLKLKILWNIVDTAEDEDGDDVSDGRPVVVEFEEGMTDCDVPLQGDGHGGVD